MHSKQIKQLAPIAITTYSRLNHLKRTISALKKNTLAIHSTLYIFSDAPKKGDEIIVGNLRHYLKGISGFKRVLVVERKKNNRMENNRGGIKYLLEKYGKCILLEDDILTSSGFLQFMNDALNFYENYDEIISICGYCPPLRSSKKFKEDSFILHRFSAWGAGFWKSKFDKFKMYLNQKEVNRLLETLSFQQKLSINGLDLKHLIEIEASGKIDALDVKIMYQQVLNDWYTVYPKKSLVQNIGLDGSGIHCGITDKFNHNELWDKVDDFQFQQRIELNYDIIYSNYLFRFKFNDFAKLKLKRYILKKFEDFNIKSIALWGYNNISQYLYELLNKNGIKVDAIIDTKAENQKMFYKDRKIETLDSFLVKNPEQYILICAVNGIDKMLNILEQKSKTVLPLIAISKEFMKMDLE